MRHAGFGAARRHCAGQRRDRTTGKGPQLMNSPRDDDYLRNRIRIGKEGAMPAFGSAFSDAQIDALIKYIRSLKPNEG